MSDEVRARLIEIVHHGDDVTSALTLIVEFGIDWLVTQSMAKGIDANDAVFVRQRIDNAGLLPAFGVQQQSMLENDKRAAAFDGVVDTLAAM